MKKNSRKAKALTETLREKHQSIFDGMNAVLKAHGHTGVRVKGFSLEADSGCPGGVPKVPVRINTPNGPTTIWVCP